MQVGDAGMRPPALQLNSALDRRVKKQSAVRCCFRIVLLTQSLTVSGFAQVPAAAVEGERPVVVISDLHMGLGRDANGQWRPTEDFRWPNALKAFLDEISRENKQRVDLVIAGDFLELWQRDVPCLGSEAAGLRSACSVAEVLSLAERVVEAHKIEFEALSTFAATGNNCIVVVPGNHDAGLVVNAVWSPVGAALGAAGGCVKRAKEGLWLSRNGRVAIEHGHQIGMDANKYPQWPEISQMANGIEYLIQPWGEAFVQQLFNAEEVAYPLVDNLSPSSAGVRLRMADRGLTGTTADIAQFLRFNLSETTLRQKAQILGGSSQDEEARWDRVRARALGHRLFEYALSPDDPLVVVLGSGGVQAGSLRTELDKVALDLSDVEVDSLCDLLAMRGAPVTCLPPTLGATFEKLLHSRSHVLKAHLVERKKECKLIEAFAYGHTHSFETPWERTIRVPGRLKSRMAIANSGAFQRLVDDDLLKAIAEKDGQEPLQYFKTHTPESLPACYTSVHVNWVDGRPALQTRAWHMEESSSAGRFVSPCSASCPNLGHGCGK